MPYDSIQDLPVRVRGSLPKHAQEIYKSAFTYPKRAAALVFCLLALILAACGTQAVQPGLENTQWELVSFGSSGAETSLVEGSMITLSAADGQAGGSGGCNSYGGEYTLQGNEISFSNVNSTLMACADDSLTQQEQQYFQALNAVKTFELKENRLMLYDAGGQLLLTFEGSTTSTPASNG